MTDTRTLRDRCRTHADSWGLLFEQSGLPRTAGRMWGWLLTSDPPSQTSTELCEALRVTKGSISTSARLLERLGIVERVARPGSRVVAYQVRPGTYETLMREKLAATSQWRALAQEGLVLLEGAGNARTRRLRDLRD